MANQLTDLTIDLEDRPGTTAAMAAALGRAGINIEGLCGFIVGGRGVGHVLVEDAAGARKALQSAGVHVMGEIPVLVLELENRPGSLGEVTRKFAAAGVNLDLVYGASENRIVFGTRNLEKARAAAGEPQEAVTG